MTAAVGKWDTSLILTGLEQTSITNVKCFNKSKGKIYWMQVLFIREGWGGIKHADPP